MTTTDRLLAIGATLLLIFAIAFATLSGCRRAEVVPLAANFTNPVDIEGSASASAPALTFQDDTDTGIWRSAANTLNFASGGSEMLEIDSSGLTISSTALDVDSSFDFDGTSFAVDASGSIDLTSTEAAADAIKLDANGTVTTGIDVDLGSVSGMTIDGGLVDIGGATAGVADGDNDVAIAGVLEVDGELEADGAVDMDAGATIDGGVTNIGGGTPDNAAGDNDLFVDGDLEVDGTIYADTAFVPTAQWLTEAITLTATDCGQTLLLLASTEFQTTLPDVSTVPFGCQYRFICAQAPSGASYTIVTGNDTEDIITGGINELEVDTGDDGPYDATADTITFVDGTAVLGDWVLLISDQYTWWTTGQANADGGITVTDSD